MLPDRRAIRQHHMRQKGFLEALDLAFDTLQLGLDCYSSSARQRWRCTCSPVLSDAAVMLSVSGGSGRSKRMQR